MVAEHVEAWLLSGVEAWLLSGVEAWLLSGVEAHPAGGKLLDMNSETIGQGGIHYKIPTLALIYNQCLSLYFVFFKYQICNLAKRSHRR